MALSLDAEKCPTLEAYTTSKEQQYEDGRVNPHQTRRLKARRLIKFAVGAAAVVYLLHALKYFAFSGLRWPSPFEEHVREGDGSRSVWEGNANGDLAALLGLPDDVFGFVNGLTDGMALLKEKRMTPKETEELFLTIPTNDSAHARSVLLASTPHRAGDEGDLITALHTLSHFQSAFGITPPRDPPIFDAGSPASRAATLESSKFGGGISAWIDKYYPVMNTPIAHSLEVLDADGKVIWTAPLEELDFSDPEDCGGCGDPAGGHAGVIGAWHGLSKGGNVTGHLVKAAYGRPEDFAELKKKGIELEGCVALVSYGKIFRGLKVKASQEAGCVATLIYSDPYDDLPIVSPAYAQYPYGPARQKTAIQRGSVQYLSLYPGDPTTPGTPAYPNASRLDGGNVPGIPSLPLSAANTEDLLNLVYEDGTRKVRVVNEVDDRVIPIWNVMAVIPGHIADEVVVLGNHRDAWVTGAADPISGAASVHEIVEGFSVLLEKGWRPLRTIMFASWDAEEYGLIGSTEWGEDFPDWTREHVVAYLNLDGSASGSRFHLSASPSLAHLVRSAAESVPHPTDANRTVWEARADNGPFEKEAVGTAEAGKWRDERLQWKDEEDELRALYNGAIRAQGEPEVGVAEYTGVGALGSGSDFTVLLQHIGVASSDGGFGATNTDGVYHYHSVYDSVTWMERYGDPGYHRHTAVAKYLGLTTLRMADSIILPINTTQYAYELSYYLSKVEDIAAVNSLALDLTPLHDAIISLQVASVSLDIEKDEAEKDLLKQLKKYMKRSCRRSRRRLCMHRRLSRLRNRVKAIFGVRSDDAAEKKKHQSHSRVPKKLIKAAKRVRAVNKQLMSFERNFISSEGLKDRGWYRNVLVAPGLWLGYGATTFPGLTEAITLEGNSTLAGLEAVRLTEHVQKAVVGLQPQESGCSSKKKNRGAFDFVLTRLMA